jgi:hypothetical protein
VTLLAYAAPSAVAASVQTASAPSAMERESVTELLCVARIASSASALSALPPRSTTMSMKALDL